MTALTALIGASGQRGGCVARRPTRAAAVSQRVLLRDAARGRRRRAAPASPGHRRRGRSGGSDG